MKNMNAFRNQTSIYDLTFIDSSIPELKFSFEWMEIYCKIGK